MKLELLKEMVDRAERFGYTDDQLDHATILYRNLKTTYEDTAEFGDELRRAGYLKSGNSLLEVAEKIKVVLRGLEQTDIIRRIKL